MKKILEDLLIAADLDINRTQPKLWLSIYFVAGPNAGESISFGAGKTELVFGSL